MPSPRIAIPIPTSFDREYNDRSWPEFARAVEQSDGTPVPLALGGSITEVRDVLESCQGIVLPGSGADVEPSRYGHERQEETAPADSAREAIDLQALQYAEDTGTPLLAICFGLQFLNVHRGGTLVQHLAPIPVNHRAGRAVSAAHAVFVSPESCLGRIAVDMEDVGKDTSGSGLLRTFVNSSHHQAVGTPGEGLRIVARSAEDAVIEGLEDATHPWLIGVQWHPERTMAASAASRRIFQSFVDTARFRL